MKVLWISQNIPYPPKSGVLLRNYNLIRQASRFAEIDLVAIAKRTVLPGSYGKEALSELGKLCSVVETVRLQAEESRIQLWMLLLKSLFSATSFTVNWAASKTLRDVLERRLASATYDLVYFDSISLARYRKLVVGPRRVLNHHNIESQLFSRRIAYERNPLLRFYLRLEAAKLRRYEAAVAGEFDANLVVSDLDASRLSEIRPGVRTAVVANGVDTGYFRPSDNALAEPGHLIMVSGMSWFPNLDAVLFMTGTIWPLLTSVLPNVRLTIIGASPPQRVKDLEARDSRITVTGFVDDIRPYMDRAQVYLCPMRDGGGTRLKILDALSMGKPIVGTTIALEGIDVTPEKEVLVGDTPDAFVRQIRRLVEDASLRERVSSNARSFVEKRFSWEVIGGNMERLFRDLTAGRVAQADFRPIDR
jgi:glycosyltransferase involved in cell wall biosynthesis